MMDRRPTGSNADEWHLFLSEHLDNRANFPNGLTYVAVQIAEAIDAATPAVDLKPVAWRVDSKRKSQPNIWFYYEPEWPAMHEKQGDIVTPLYAAPPASPLRESVNDKVREIVYQMSPSDQYDLAFKVAENVGYMLVREPDHPDSPHLTSPPEQPVAVTGRDDVIAECAAIADKYDDCGGSFIAQKIRDLY